MLNDKKSQASNRNSEALSSAQAAESYGFEMQTQNMGKAGYSISPLAPNKAKKAGGDTLVALPVLRVGF